VPVSRSTELEVNVVLHMIWHTSSFLAPCPKPWQRK
jgi:hypothetical protein